MSFPAYEKYKDSRVGWLGQVPSHWKFRRLKHVAKVIGGGTPSRENLAYWNGDIPWVSPKDMKSEYISEAEEGITKLGLRNSSTTYQPCGQVLMVIRSGILQHALPIAINTVPVALNQDMKSIRFIENSCSPKFFLRWVQGLNDDLLLAWANQGATVESIDQTLFQNTIIPLPPAQEQRAITSFLDQETAKIDDLITEQQRLIELLKEKRQAVISHAVTNGLDRNVPRKPSGIEWLGDVPEHWEVKSLRRFSCKVQTGPFGSQLHADEYVSGGTPVVNPTHMINGKIVPSDDITVNDEVLDRLSHQRLELGDVVFSRRGELGRCALVTKREVGWLCGTGSMIVRLHQAEYVSGFLSLFLSLDLLRMFFESLSIGSVMNSLSSETLLSMPLVVPPLNEQREMVHFATIEAERIDSLTSDAEQAIQLLQERRTALISAAVTGKIDVREFVYQESA